MTAEEFYDWCHLDENRDRNYEMKAGVVVSVPSTELLESVVCSNVNGILRNYTHARKAGYVCMNNSGLILERNPDTVLGPDLALFLDKRRFAELEIGYTEHLPALAVEVWSSQDCWDQMLKRVQTFLESDIAIVWVIEPKPQTLTIFLPNRQSIILGCDDDVVGIESLPGFRCKVSDFFTMAGE